MDPRVQKVITLMREEFHRDPSLNEMAQSVNLSPSRLRYLFKVEVGVPPAQYLRAFKMQRAKELLETTFLTVKQIRHSIGVNDHSHFVRDFKKSFGMSPAQYRTTVAAPEIHTSLEGLLVLVVDDERETRDRIETILEKAGACVTTISSARQALAALQRMRPHILIIDIGLPNEDAYELIAKARVLFQARGEQIPAVALAPQSLEGAADAAFEGFEVHVPHPPGPNQLVNAIAELAEKYLAAKPATTRDISDNELTLRSV